MTTYPNILLLFTDQQRFDTIAALGNPLIRTPVLDRLADEGTAFGRCYTPSPVCVSARCAVVTGLPPHKSGCVDNMPMPQDQPSFMQALAGQGYQTFGTGKMHFSPDKRYLWGFEARDFSEEMANEGDEYLQFLAEQGYGYVDDAHGVRSEYYYLPQPSQLPAHLHHTHWVADRSIDFLQRRDRSRPFFLWSSFIKPHPPFENPVPWNKLYRAAEMPRPFRPEGYERNLTYWNRVQNRYKYRDAGFDDRLLQTMRAAYYGCISFIDYNVGRILDALGAEIDNTLILYTADHGELLGDYGSFGKRSMLDAAARVPLLVRWPERFAPGARCDAPVSLLDLWPTFLSAAGLAEPRVDPEGDDLARVAAGQSERDYVFSQFSRGRLGLYLVTDGRFKYSYSAADEREWLFDTRRDPGETQNLAANPMFQPQVARLRRVLIERFQAAGYEEAVDAEGWRLYGRAPFPEDPDEGLLFQDTAQAQALVNALGPYARLISPAPEAGARFFRERKP